MHGRPRFAKRSFHDGSKVKIAAMHPDSLFGAFPWSLMESAGQLLYQQSAFLNALTSAGFAGHGLTCLAINA